MQTNHEDWARHRKITAPCFNERVSQTVWTEAGRQARSMLDNIFASGTQEVYTNLDEDTRVIALHTLTGAGLGKFHSFTGGVREVEPGHLFSFGDSLFQVLKSIRTILVFRPLFTPKTQPYLPKGLAEVCKVTLECGRYFDEMVDQQKSTNSEIASKPQKNLLSSLVKASSDADEEKARGFGSGGLSKEEIRGNLYIFTFAGHETTANAMAYAISYLAAYPKWQQWVVEELDAILKLHKADDYEEIYPQLVRCQAVLVSGPR